MESITGYENGRDILIYSFRYTLGRASYSVSTMVETILAEWGNLSDHDKQLFKREINQAIESNMAGMDMDITEWKKILDMED